MANSLMSFLGNFGGSSNIMMQAVGAFMRGDSPQAFLQNLARTNPNLRGLDLTDINATAQKVCSEHGVDANKLAADIKNMLPK
jgi:hypothetical protein